MVTMRHQLLETLREFDREAARLVPADFDEGLGQMGLLLADVCENRGYWCTPINTVSFGGTGGDGVHFNLLVRDDAVTDDAPVIMTVPASGGEMLDMSLVVGENLREFLCFGLLRGYFGLEQLAYDRDLTLEVYASPDWSPTEDWHCAVGYALDEVGQRVSDLLSERLNLRPRSYTVAEFEALQKKYGPMLEFPVGESF